MLHGNVGIIASDRIWSAFQTASSDQLRFIHAGKNLVRLGKYDFDLLIVAVSGDERECVNLDAVRSAKAAGQRIQILVFDEAFPDIDIQGFAAAKADPTTVRTSVSKLLRSEIASTYLKPRSDVFISYNRGDPGIAEDVFSAFARTSYACWMDKKCLNPGVNWSVEIDHAIGSSKLFCATLTKGYLRSRYCAAELDYAIEADRPLLFLDRDGLYNQLSGRHGLPRWGMKRALVKDLISLSPTDRLLQLNLDIRVARRTGLQCVVVEASRPYGFELAGQITDFYRTLWEANTSAV